MARVAMVTRTIQSTKVKALCVDINEQKPFENEYVLSGTYKDAKSLMKALEKVANTNTVKVVHIKASEIVEKLYGMTEQEFLERAKELPPRGTKENKE
ncbi:MAG: hypothetical protein J6T10_30600 [Methanobrevibacter sp.]|nr:hypothetical protein [Methanobrevibacter sp.]